MSAQFTVSKAVQDMANATVDFFNELEKLGEDLPPHLLALADNFSAASGLIPELKEDAAASSAETPTRHGRKPKVQRRRYTIDPDAPKKPTTSYFLFAADERKAIREELGTLTNNEMTVELAKRWNKLSEEKRQPWKQKYLEHFEEYKERKRAYLEEVAKKRAAEDGGPVVHVSDEEVEDEDVDVGHIVAAAAAAEDDEDDDEPASTLPTKDSDDEDEDEEDEVNALPFDKPKEAEKEDEDDDSDSDDEPVQSTPVVPASSTPSKDSPTPSKRTSTPRVQGLRASTTPLKKHAVASTSLATKKKPSFISSSISDAGASSSPSSVARTAAKRKSSLDSVFESAGSKKPKVLKKSSKDKKDKKNKKVKAKESK